MMATLVNREAWHVAGGILLYGRVVEQRYDPNVSVLLLANGDRRVVASVNLLLTIDKAINECEEFEQYWKERVAELEHQRDLSEPPCVT